MKEVVFLLISFLVVEVSAQVVVDQNTIDFGVLDAHTNRVVDLTFTNVSPQPALMLRSSFPPDYTFRWTRRDLEPDSSLTLRIKVNPRINGPFQDEVVVWFSNMDTPLELSFSGDVKAIDTSDNPACPSFRDMPPGCCDGNACEVLTTDAQTGAPLGRSRVRLVELGRLRETWETDRSGRLNIDVPIAYYLVIADHEGYSPKDTSLYINRRTGRLELALQPLPDPDRPLAPGATEALPPVALDQAPTAPDPNLSTRPRTEVLAPTAPLDDGFSTADYAPNNIVFLVDVSASMNKQGRLDLLKASMYSLTEMLRPEDQVAIVTYAASPEVVMAPTGGERKAEIESTVQRMEAGGMTYGVKGFRAAYALAQDHWIKGGNNEVIVVTDGAFRVQDQEKIERQVGRASEQGIVTTVVGIRSNPALAEKLTALGDTGNGSFVEMTDFDQCQEVLVAEIKLQSRR